jgi:hypothetical protein
VLMAGYVAVRAAAAKITPERRATVEAVWLFLAYTAAQGVAIALVARILPVAGGGA